MRTILFALLCALSTHAAPPRRPSVAKMRRAFEHTAPSLVEVRHQAKRGPGVIIGAGGEVLTSVDHVGLYAAQVVLEPGSAPLDAEVIFADARSRVAVLRLKSPPGPLPAPPVRAASSLEEGRWLLGLRFAMGRRMPLSGQVVAERTLKTPFVRTSLALPPGSPLFDPSGRLVAVVVDRAGRTGSWALPVAAVRAQLERAAALEAPR